MRRTSPALVPVCLVTIILVATAGFCFGQTGPQNRIAQAIDQSRMMAVNGNVHPWARAEFDRGRLDPTTEIEGISLNFRLSASQQAGLDELLAEQQDRS